MWLRHFDANSHLFRRSFWANVLFFFASSISHNTEKCLVNIVYNCLDRFQELKKQIINEHWCMFWSTKVTVNEIYNIFSNKYIKIKKKTELNCSAFTFPCGFLSRKKWPEKNRKQIPTCISNVDCVNSCTH